MAVLRPTQLMLFVSVLVVLANRSDALSDERLATLKVLENKLVNIAQYYIDAETKEIDHLQKFLKHAKPIHVAATEDVEEFSGDPIRAFQLLKRYVMDWREIHNIVNASAARSESIEFFAQIEKEFPIAYNSHDLQGAVKRLVRLQEINDFTASDVAEGAVNGSTLTWHNCFEIGSSLIEQKKYELGIDWLNVTVSMIDDDVKATTQPHLKKYYIDALESMAIAYNEMGAFDTAIEYFEEILSIDPGHNAKTFLYYINKAKDAEIENVSQSSPMLVEK